MRRLPAVCVGPDDYPGLRRFPPRGRLGPAWLVSHRLAIERFAVAAAGAAVHKTGEAIRKLLHVIYLSEPEFRRTIHALLVQGEAAHRQTLCFAT